MGWGGLECGSDQKVAQVPVALVGCKGGPAEKGCEFGVVLNGEIAEQDLLDWDVVGVEGQSEQRAVVQGPSFTGPSGRSFTIRGAFTCQTSDVVYIVSCSLCHQLYIGETYRTLGERAREHRDSINQKRNTPVANHFTSQFHNLSHFSVAAIWRNSSGDPLYRKYMEKRVINSLGTTSPQGINLRD